MQYKINQEPVTTAKVTVPITMLLIVTVPSVAMMTGKGIEVERVVPKTSETLRKAVAPLAKPPAVATFREQGWTVTT